MNADKSFGGTSSFQILKMVSIHKNLTVVAHAILLHSHRLLKHNTVLDFNCLSLDPFFTPFIHSMTPFFRFVKILFFFFL